MAALHFLCFTWALTYTTVAHALALTYTAPIFVTLFAVVLLKEPLRGRQLLGLPVTVLGVAIMTGFEPKMDSQMVLGDLIAVGSAIFFGLYSVAGRRERARYPLFVYAGSVYLAAALWCPVAALAPGGPPSVTSMLAVVGLGLLPLAVGHTLYNASLRRVHPTYVNLIATQEVTGGVILSYLMIGENRASGRDWRGGEHPRRGAYDAALESLSYERLPPAAVVGTRWGRANLAAIIHWPGKHGPVIYDQQRDERARPVEEGQQIAKLQKTTEPRMAMTNDTNA